MSAVQPKDLNAGIPQRGAVAHFQEPDDNSFKHLEEDISRLQSAVQQYQMIPYKVGDFAIENNIMYRNISAIAVGEAFDSLKWKPVDPNSPVEVGRAVVSGSAVDTVVLTLDRITKYIRINFSALNATGDMMLLLSFNGDNIASNQMYAENDSINFSGPTNPTLADSLLLTNSGTVTDDYTGEISLTNIANKVKVGHTQVIASNGLDASMEPFIKESVILWINSISQIATIEFINSGVSPNGIGIGSEFIAMGWD